MIYIRDSRLGLLAALLKAHIVDGEDLTALSVFVALRQAEEDPTKFLPKCTLCGKPYWSEEADGECGCPWLALLGAEDSPHAVAGPLLHRIVVNPQGGSPECHDCGVKVSAIGEDRARNEPCPARSVGTDEEESE